MLQRSPPRAGIWVQESPQKHHQETLWDVPEWQKGQTRMDLGVYILCAEVPHFRHIRLFLCSFLNIF